MNLAALALVAAAAYAPTPAAAGDGAPAPASPLQLRPKAAMAVLTLNPQSAPFLAPSNESDLELFPQRDARLDASRSACTGERSLCYDPFSGRIVFKPARMLMPEIPGLRRENISVKRDRIVLRYSW